MAKIEEIPDESKVQYDMKYTTKLPPSRQPVPMKAPLPRWDKQPIISRYDDEYYVPDDTQSVRTEEYYLKPPIDERYGILLKKKCVAMEETWN